MSWVRYDDGFHHHDKVMQVRDADPGALALHLLANTWTAASGKPGWVPAHVARQLVGAKAKRWAQILTDAGLWDVHEEDGKPGWWIHDFKEYNPWAASPPDARSESARRAANARWSKREDAVSHAESCETDAEPHAESMQNDAIARGHPLPLPTEPTVPFAEASLGDAAKPVEPKAQRPRDELFDALAEACGVTPGELTKSGRGAFVGALKQLRDVEATPNQVRLRSRRYLARFSGVELTAPALAKHWASLGDVEPESRPWQPKPWERIAGVNA